ncbi:uncharacterized protein K441DRAFT_178532 [Cenococcum geophilum 1.58]|uniref:uncharacterized protein n=1 Tax=Cenococcum geophilum 1.58 TaxID=794803 RepID=UPI00358F6808|nr:hypothetical protein K441DRAFT_178532 [Cenococcum geophilum 1.58]
MYYPSGVFAIITTTISCTSVPAGPSYDPSTLITDAISGLPSCAQTGVINTIANSNCNPADRYCLCRNTVLQSNIASIIVQSCTSTDQIQASTFITNLCPNIAAVVRPTVTTNTSSSSSASITVAPTQISITSTLNLTTTIPPSLNATTITSTNFTTPPFANSSTVTLPSPTNTNIVTISTNPNGEVATVTTASPSAIFTGAAVTHTPPFGAVRLGFVITGMAAMGFIFAEL